MDRNMWREEDERDYNNDNYDDMHTGDPRRDLDFERQQHHQQSYIVPEMIKNFLLYFQNSIQKKDIYEIQNAYENGFNKLTERFFKNTPWPDPEVVMPIVGKDEIFIILYSELYYRHIYACVPSGPTMQQRFESYYNYCSLFNYILSAKQPVPLELPSQWMWDIIDEFIYQFQAFSHYRAKLSKKTEEDIKMLKENPKMWNVHSVLNVLHCMIEKSNINQQLEVYSAGGKPEHVAGEFGSHNLYKMLGYFSLVGLLRLHSLLSDYYQALKVIENVDVNKKTMYTQVPACQITTYYYVGFAYMMMRRYADAIRTFNNILVYIQRTKNMLLNKNYTTMYDQINKQNDQMYVLLAMCLSLHPTRVDEGVQAQLQEKFADKQHRLQKGDRSEYEASFQFACPKFLSPVPPNYEMLSHNSYKEPFLLQQQVFMNEVEQQQYLSTIRSYLKLYTTLPLAKLAAFMDMPADELMTHLICYKHKMRSLVWVKGKSALDGELQSCSDVDFYIDKNMIHIADTKVSRRYGDFFIRQIHKMEEYRQTLVSLKK